MKILLLATALTMSGSALAYQTYPSDSATVAVPTTSVDPTVVITVPTGWTPEERALWEEQMDFHPGWTAQQVATFDAMMAIPPASWTPEQRALYSHHLTHYPATWTPAQRTAFERQIAAMRTPWLSATETAHVDHSGTAATYAAAPASAAVVQPSNANPERDARGIAVISDVAYVPPGYNGIGGAMGGPVEGDNESYPACTATVTDNCIQLYERGVRASLDSSTRATGVGGPVEEGNDNTPEDDALDIDTKPDGTLDVDGDLDNDGDNDIE